MEIGYIKLWRKTINSFIFTDPAILKLWLLCLLKASYKKYFVAIDGIIEPIELQPGQFITGRFALHKDFYGKKKKNIKSPLTVWRWLELLEKCENLNIKSYNKYSIITINNWKQYQQDEQQMNNRRTTDEQQMNTNKKDKKEKNNKEIYYTEDFLNFYSAYPLKKAKQDAFKMWQKHKPPIDICLKAIKAQKLEKIRIKENKEFCPEWKHPATWINKGCWEDEPSNKPEIEKEYI